MHTLLTFMLTSTIWSSHTIELIKAKVLGVVVTSRLLCLASTILLLFDEVDAIKLTLAIDNIVALEVLH